MKHIPFRTALFVIAAVLLSSAAQTQTLYTFPGSTFTPVYAFINSATKTLDMTMYELVDTTAVNDLVALAKKGVTVRVILDQNEEKASNQAAYTALTKGGVSVHWANPAYTVTHQKTITVDSATSLILTANLTSQYYTTTRDFAITDTDAKDVAEIETVFNDDFKNATVTPTAADTLYWSPNLAEVDLVGFINSAKHVLLVENEEMSDPSIVSALSASAKAGVAVTVIMTNDNNVYQIEFETLTAAGVKVYTYPYNTTALYIHAKAMSLDYGYPNQNAYLGSINFSTTSLTKNRELGQTTQASAVLQTIDSTLTTDAKGGTLWTKASAAAQKKSTRANTRVPFRKPS